MRLGVKIFSEMRVEDYKKYRKAEEILDKIARFSEKVYSFTNLEQECFIAKKKQLLPFLENVPLSILEKRHKQFKNLLNVHQKKNHGSGSSTTYLHSIVNILHYHIKRRLEATPEVRPTVPLTPRLTITTSVPTVPPTSQSRPTVPTSLESFSVPPSSAQDTVAAMVYPATPDPVGQTNTWVSSVSKPSPPLTPLAQQTETNKQEKESLALKEKGIKLINSEKIQRRMVEFLSKSIQEKEISLGCPICLEVAKAPIYTCQV